MTVRDLSRVLHPPLPATADKVLTVWSENREGLDTNTASVSVIMDGIDEMRSETLLLLESLE